MKIDASLMFDPMRNGVMAAELEQLAFDGVYSFEDQHDTELLGNLAGTT